MTTKNDNNTFISTYATKLGDGGFRGFVLAVRVRGHARTEQVFPCASVRETEEQALADALALTELLPD